MAFPAASVSEIAGVIQLSVAPVFLLAGVGAIVNAMSTRLGRAVDRARDLESELDRADAAQTARIHDELRAISQRARLVTRAIALAVLCALLVTLLLIAAFFDAFLATDLSFLLAAIFVAALVAFSASLLMFLRDPGRSAATPPRGGGKGHFLSSGASPFHTVSRMIGWAGALGWIWSARKRSRLSPMPSSRNGT